MPCVMPVPESYLYRHPTFQTPDVHGVCVCVFCSICSRMGKFSQKNETWMSQGDSQANRLQERVDLLPTFTGPKLGRTSAGSFFVVRHCSRRLHGWMVFENSHGIQVKKMVQIKRTTAVHVGKKTQNISIYLWLPILLQRKHKQHHGTCRVLV